MNKNMLESIYDRSSINISQFLFAIGQLKQLLFGQINCNLVGCTHVRFCIQIPQHNLEGSGACCFCNKKKEVGLLKGKWKFP